MLDFPVVTLIRFWANHHLLDITQRPCWRVVSGRGKQYVDNMVAGGPLMHRIRQGPLQHGVWDRHLGSGCMGL